MLPRRCDIAALCVYDATQSNAPGAMTYAAKKRAMGRRAQAAREGAVVAAKTFWVVGTGASRHACPPEAVGGRLRPTSPTVETANGRVGALGEATVRVEAINAHVDAAVLPTSPPLLSAGQLARQGCS